MVIASALLLMISCKNAVNVDKLLKDETTRNQMFDKIATDHEMMTGFIDVMMNWWKKRLKPGSRELENSQI